MSRYLLLFLWLRLGSSFVSYSQRKYATTRLHAADGALDELLLSLNDPQVDNLPGPGLCNELCRIRDGEKDYVAKIFSDMAKQRRPITSFEVDILASDHHLGPEVLAHTNDGILMEYLGGRTLDEETVHQPNQHELLDRIATQLKRLHSLSPPKPETNMLWYSLNAMLEGSCRKELKEQHQYHKSQISPLLQNTQCLGHGDFKGSNVILCSNNDIRFIDYELSGLQYRGFDVAKFFRTDLARNVENFQYFIQSYTKGDEQEAEALRLEAEVLEPLTWLEAAIFFDYASRNDTSDAWEALYDARIASYKRSMRGHEDRVASFRAERGTGLSPVATKLE